MNVAVVNYSAIVLAALFSNLLGLIWFSPPLFGKKRSNLMKGSDKSMPMSEHWKRGNVMYFFTSLLTAYIMAHFVDFAGATTLYEGVQVGGWLWLGFVATFSFSRVIWEGNHMDLWAINNGYYLLSLAVQGAILATLI